MPRRSVQLPKPSLLDRAIGVLSPRAMNARLHEKVKTARYNAMAAGGRGGYDAGDRTRRVFKNARRLDGSADAALLPVAEDLRVLSSDLVRNNPLAAGALDTIATKVVGQGLKLQARPDRKYLKLSDDEAQQIEAELERLWAHFEDRADYRRVDHLADLEYQALHLFLEHGDVFVVLTGDKGADDLFNLKVQLVEGGRVCNPDNVADTDKIAGGVEFENGKPVAYHVASRHPLDYSRTASKVTWTRVPAFGTKTGRRNVLHIMEATRANQTRGVPILATCLELFKQLGDWSSAEITAAVMNSCFAIVSHTEGGGAIPETNEDAASDSTSAGGLGRVDFTFESGLLLDGLGPNEEVKGFAATRPNPDFDPFFISMCRQIAVRLGLSASIMIRHFTASYSASRGEMLQVWEIVMRRRAMWARKFRQPLYAEMAAEGVERGIIALRGWSNPLMRAAWLKGRWIGPSQGQLNPKDEVEAAALKVQHNFSTEEEQTAEITGGDYDSNIEQRAREVKRNREAGIVEAPPAAAAPSEPRPDPDTEDETAQAS